MADEKTYTIDEQHPVSDSKGADEHPDVAPVVDDPKEASAYAGEVKNHG